MDEANQSLEESGTPSHEIVVVVLHRGDVASSLSPGLGITLAGGADYETKEITVRFFFSFSINFSLSLSSCPFRLFQLLSLVVSCCLAIVWLHCLSTGNTPGRDEGLVNAILLLTLPFLKRRRISIK